MKPSNCKKDVGGVNFGTNGVCRDSRSSAQPFTIASFLKNNFHLFTIMGVIGTMLSVLPNLIDKYIGPDWKYLILNHQESYLPYVIVEMPIICGAIFLYAVFLLIVGLVLISDREKEENVHSGWFPIKAGDFNRIVFLLIFLPLGFTFSYFLILIPVLQKEIISILLIFFWLQFLFTIGLTIIFTSPKIFEKHKLLLGILAILYGLGFYYTLLGIPRYPSEISIVLSLVWLFLLFSFGEFFLLFLSFIRKENIVEKYQKIVIAFFSLLAVVILICLFMMTIYPIIFTPFSISDTYYGTLSLTASPPSYSVVNSSRIGIEVWPDGIAQNVNITKIGIFHLQHHYSTNFGYFLTRDPESGKITNEGQDVKVLTDEPFLKQVFWTYSNGDIGKQKPPVIINLHIEDKYIQKPFLKDSINITWKDDTAEVQENPKNEKSIVNITSPAINNLTTSSDDINVQNQPPNDSVNISWKYVEASKVQENPKKGKSIVNITMPDSRNLTSIFHVNQF